MTAPPSPFSTLSSSSFPAPVRDFNKSPTAPLNDFFIISPPCSIISRTIARALAFSMPLLRKNNSAAVSPFTFPSASAVSNSEITACSSGVNAFAFDASIVCPPTFSGISARPPLIALASVPYPADKAFFISSGRLLTNSCALSDLTNDALPTVLLTGATVKARSFHST